MFITREILSCLKMKILCTYLIAAVKLQCGILTGQLEIF